MKNKVRPFLMFEGKAEAAMTFYVSLFPRAEITQIERWGASQPGKETWVKLAAFEIGGQSIMCNDSPMKHAFTFTPASSLFVTCESEQELDRLYVALVEGGQALMPLGAYGFSRKFGWVNDRFGVSWQLNLP